MDTNQPLLANRDPEIQQTMARYAIWIFATVILCLGMYIYRDSATVVMHGHAAVFVNPTTPCLLAT